MTRTPYLTRSRPWLGFAVIAGGLLALSALPAAAQEAPKPEDRNRFDEFRSGAKPVTPDAKDLFEKYAKYFIAKLNDSATQRAGAEQGMSWLVQEFDKRLLLPPFNSPQAATYYARLNEAQKKFISEYGAVIIKALEDPALKSGKPIVRINAARMASEVARNGYDGAANLFVKILANPTELDAVKLYALKGLGYLFTIQPEPAFESKTIFQKTNAAQLPPLERQVIKALIDFIERKPETGPDLPPVNDEVVRYVRREAIRALGNSRVHAVKNLAQVECRPALTLLKAATGDGLTPTTNTSERVAAFIGFCQLIPDRDRDLNLDYAAYQLGRSLVSVAPGYRFNSKDSSLPWKLSAILMRESLDTLRKRADDLKLENAKSIRDLFDIADRDIFKQIEENAEGVSPNVENLSQWLRDNPPKNKSLFKSDPATVITPSPAS